MIINSIQQKNKQTQIDAHAPLSASWGPVIDTSDLLELYVRNGIT